jgi:hypothetical protein
MQPNQEIIDQLLQAVQVMKNACSEAERGAKSGDSRAIQKVIHCLSWGHANATGYIESAMASLS